MPFDYRFDAVRGWAGGSSHEPNGRRVLSGILHRFREGLR
jgi:hypothetical protein